MALMEKYRAHITGQTVARCPECGRILAYWDEEDLNEWGELECYCWEM
jgi:hypothetical protein